MKRLTSLLAVLVLVLVGCGTSNTTGSEVATEITEPVTIDIWHPFTADLEAQLTEITEEFNNSQDMITVELTNQGSYDDLYTKLVASSSSDTLPVMSFAYSSWEDIRDLVSDLSGYEGLNETTLSFDNIVPAYLDEMTGEEGQIFGIPYNKSTEVVFYNKDLVKEAGITSLPTSYDELLEDAQLIYDNTGVTGIGFDSLKNYFATVMNSCGYNEWMDEEGNFMFADECSINAVQEYKDAIESGAARTAGEDGYLSGPFGAGTVAAYVGSTAGASYIESGVNGAFEWGAITLPTPSVVQQGTNIVVFDSATSEEKLAAWTYIDYLLKDENVVSFAEATGYLPVTQTSINTDEYQEYLTTNEVAKAAADTIENLDIAVPTNFLGANEIYSTNFNTAMVDILDGDADVTEELQGLVEQAKAIFDRNN